MLGGVADTVAQTLTTIRIRSQRLHHPSKEISDGIEMPSYPDYDEKTPFGSEYMIPLRPPPPPAFDFERLTRFMAYGFIMSPLQFQWFSFLSRAFPITKSSKSLPAMQREAFDKLNFEPISMMDHP